MSVTNVGQHPGKFCFKSLDGLVIADSAGTPYRTKLHIDRTMGEIQPQETAVEEGNILSLGYGLPLGEARGEVFCYLPSGKYTICHRLNQTGVSGGSLFAESTVDTFEVMEPHGEDSLALELLLESYNLWIEKKHDESAEKLRELLEKYPESVYVPYVMLKTANTVEKWREIIRRFPEGGEAIAAVNSIAYHFTIEKDQAAYIQAMNELINQYPDTDIARVASRLKSKSDRFFRERPKPDRSDQ